MEVGGHEAVVSKLTGVMVPPQLRLPGSVRSPHLSLFRIICLLPFTYTRGDLNNSSLKDPATFFYNTINC